VVADWTPRLAPSISAAAFHGLIRTAHAVRALRRSETPQRRRELANGLAYWAARYAELPTVGAVPHSAADLIVRLAKCAYPRQDDSADADFFAVSQRLGQVPIALPELGDVDPATALDELVHVAAAGFLEMLIQERHRIWMLHTVTGPAAVALLLPHVDVSGARRLVAYAHQAVEAFFAAFGAPFEARAHVREEPAEWPELVAEAVASGSVHTIKLVEALQRHDRRANPLLRSVAMQWLAWR